ncbi:MAG: hypothetical protein ACSHWQ_07295, partial [Spongiibacteraceae bacterium]
RCNVGTIMKIAAAQVNLSSARQAVEEHQQRERLHAWKDGQGEVLVENQRGRLSASVSAEQLRAGPRTIDSLLNSPASEANQLQISPAARAMQAVPVEASQERLEHLSPEQELEFMLLKLLVEQFTHRKVEVFRPAELATENPAVSDIPDTSPASDSGERVGWGLRYDYYESHYESENTSFSATAKVLTTDGRELDITLELNMSREFYSSTSVQLRAGDALKDPLVVNFAAPAAALTQNRFSFDIDADGQDDQIAFVGPGSGFLALDKNGNGMVDNGRELFGALSGNGFADLAKHDQDGNGWIDESDAIYEHLRIWSRDADGNDRLVALSSKDVGAIYLGHVGTEFKLADHNNVQQGQIRDSGIFLRDGSGGSGTVQQIDIVV